MTRKQPSPTTREGKKADRRRVVSLTLLTFSVLAISGGLYFYVSIMGKQTYLIERNFRLLSQWSAELSRTVETYQKAIESIYQELSFCPKEVEEGSAVQVYTKDETCRITGGYTGDLKDIYKARLEENLRNGTGVESIDVHPLESPQASNVETLSEFQSIGQESKSLLRLEYHIYKSADSNQERSRKAYRVVLGLDIGTLFERIISRNPFDDVLWAGNAGDVYYQVNPTLFHLENIQGVFAMSSRRGPEGLEDLTQPQADPSDEGNMSIRGATGDAGREETQEKSIAYLPDYVSTSLGGMSYEVFTQPVYFPGNQGVLVALVKTENFRSEYLAIPYRYLMTFIVIVIVLLVSWPFLKLVMIGENDRVPPIHVLGLVMSSTVGPAIITIYLLSVWAYTAEKAEIQSRLEQAATQIKAGFDTELKQAINVMEAKRTSCQNDLYQDYQRITKQSDRQGQGDSSTNGCWDKRNVDRGSTDVVVRTVAGICDGQSDRGSCDRGMVLAYWIDPDGFLRINWAPEGKPTVNSKLSLKQREYVKSIRQERFWRGEIGGDTKRFYIQPIISWTTGWKTAVVSMPAGFPTGPPKDQWISAIELRFQSLMDSPVVPPWASFAIINNEDGKVLFHSEPDRSLRENLFSETDDNPVVRSLAGSRDSAYIEGHYWGQYHGLYVTPIHNTIKDIPWTLVTYRNLEIADEINFRVGVITGIILGIYIGLGVLLTVILVWIPGYMSRNPGNAGNLFWPSAVDERTYWVLMVVNSALIVIGLGMFMLGDGGGGWLIYSGTVLGYVMGVSILAFVKGRKEGTGKAWNVSGRKRERVDAIYTIVVFSGIVACACIPAALFYKFAYETEMIPYEKYKISTLWKSLKATKKLPSLRADGVHGLASEALEGEGSLGLSLNGVYPALGSLHICADGQACGENGRKDATAACGDWMLCENDPGVMEGEGGVDGYGMMKFRRALRLSTPIREESADILGFTGGRERRFRSGQDVGAPGWITNSRGFVGLAEDRDGKIMIVSEKTPSIASALSQWGQTSAGAWIGMMGPGLVFLGTAYWLTRWILGRIFFVGFQMPALENPKIPTGEEEARKMPNMLILGPPGAGKTRLAREKEAQGVWSRIDVRMRREDEEERTQACSIVALDHFEYGLGSRRKDLEKKKLLKTLLQADKRVIVFSDMNPVERSPEVWSDVFRSFAVTYYWEGSEARQGASDASGEAGVDSETLKTWRDRGDQSGGAGESRRLARMERILDQECSINRHLGNLGQWVRRQNKWFTVDPDRLVSMIGRLAEPYYRSVWRTCSSDEKLALMHLAQDGYLHAAHPKIPQLFQKRLVLLAPNLRLMNESFRRFVLAIGREENVGALETEGVQSTWNLIKWPLGLALGAMLLFLVTTQQAIRTSMGGLVSLLPLLLPALAEFSGLSQQGKAESK